MFKSLLETKEQKWTALKDEASGRMMELSDVFGGNVPLSRIEKNEDLQAYFAKTSKQIAAFDYSNSTSAGRKIVQLIQALDEVQEFHQLQNSLQVRQFLQETQQGLKQMMRTINIKEETLQRISVIADLSYAWQIIDTYTPLMQAGIKANPALVIKLRATFLKLASALELPLVRISQVGSPDLVSVSEFYSSELVSYVRKVLQIIPRSMFTLLEEIIKLQTVTMREVPTRLDKDKLKDFAQLDLREKVSELTYKISVFTEGILMMKSTLVGVVEVDPKQLLEDGIRKELVNQVARAFDTIIAFEAQKGKEPEMLPRLRALAKRLQGIKRSFEYIQDYVSIYGLKIWQEEVSRIINFNVEQECNAFLRTQTLESDSLYQSKAIPIPKFPPRDRESRNFIGRLARQLLRRTAPETAMYLEKTRSWYDLKTRAKVLGPDMFKEMQESLDTFGLNGLDKLFSFMLVADLQKFSLNFRRLSPTAKQSLVQVREHLHPFDANVSAKTYTALLQSVSRLTSAFADRIVRIGHIQLLRRMISTQLNYAAKFDGKLMLGALTALNTALLSEVEQHYQDPTKPYPGGDSLVLAELSEYLEAVGEADPLAKIYVTTKKLDHLAAYAFFTTLAQLQRIVYSRPIGSMVARKPGDAVDGPAFVCGMLTLLKQFHTTHTHMFLDLAGQYIRSHVQSVTENPKHQATDLPPQVTNMLAFLEEMARFGKIPRKVLQAHIPSYLLDEYKHHAA
ncbi:WASH complex subunit strumpellin [Salpingoeca rosetta]|uniref:WASH complex subunit strumpellin n=1 Tax=Salpingoeca rosetta (strain ATCC 50818 / BSB-021) TaxID=946362 RepID=F2UN85_SALR5|nr:WASH complex subunit strumpellin [Salpingoeca rosetta]EGD78584.1 WASH complex subunit strumpellin [Salpingoeca rosetta]|eukprot:XP_004989533.1 WASH complex subunit strumpellin [Salpingoeca rosetta]